MSLAGLAKKLANDETLRAKILADDALVAWPSAEITGVVTHVDSQRMNSYLLKFIADFWCPQWTSPAMIPLNDIKDQASRVTKKQKVLSWERKLIKREFLGMGLLV